MTWGIHTIIDLKDCDPETIRSYEKINIYLLNIVKLLKMRAHGFPEIINFGDDPEIKGYTFTQLIYTSLISGHLVELNNRAYIDIFSCKPYDTTEAAKFTKKFFGAHTMIKKVIKRGDTW